MQSRMSNRWWRNCTGDTATPETIIKGAISAARVGRRGDESTQMDCAVHRRRALPGSR